MWLAALFRVIVNLPNDTRLSKPATVLHVTVRVLVLVTVGVFYSATEFYSTAGKSNAAPKVKANALG